MQYIALAFDPHPFVGYLRVLRHPNMRASNLFSDD